MVVLLRVFYLPNLNGNDVKTCCRNEINQQLAVGLNWLLEQYEQRVI